MMSAPNPSTAATEFLAHAHGNFIGGSFNEPNTSRLIAVENPAREQMIGQVCAASTAELDAAVLAARQALNGAWGSLSARDRAQILLRFADLLHARADFIAEIETLENGAPIALTRATISSFCVDLFRYYAGWATKIEGSTIPAKANGREQMELLVYTLREPVGVIGAIIPWNAPAGMLALKMAPALAAGCTLVLKTADLAPLTGVLFAQLWQEAGGPPGSFNLIHGGADVGAALVRHRGVDKISFTGSTAVGQDIVRAVADDLKRVTLELGGKSPFVVFADAPLEEAIPSAALACFFMSGQNCMAGTRLFVHEAIATRFMDGLATMVQHMKVGDGLASDTVIGPLISAKHKARVQAYIDSGVAEGARIAVQGVTPTGRGHFLAPVVLTGVTPEMRVAREEIFGPVLVVQTFGDDEDALAHAVNATTYGLSGSVWTSDLRRAHRFVKRIDSGQVGINIHAAVSPETPFGGNRQSGWGREFGGEGLDAYLKTKAVSVNLGVRS